MMPKAYCYVQYFLLLLFGGGNGQIKDCNKAPKLFSYDVRDAVNQCSLRFHRDLQNYYKTEMALRGHQIQPARAIPSPSPVSLSTVFFANTSNWEEICQLWVEAAACLIPAIEGCETAVAFRLLQDRMAAYEWSEFSAPQYLAAEYAFSERTCESGRVRADLQADINSGQLDLSCLTEMERMELNQCVNPVTAEVLDFRSRNIYTSKSDKLVLDRMSYSTMRCIRNLLDMSKCKGVNKKFWYHIGELQLPSIFINTPDITQQPFYNISLSPRCSVGVYGDPHLLLCDNPSLITCSLRGEHVYLANQFMKIQATNTAIGDTMSNPRATAVTGVEVEFKSVRTSMVIGSYRASASSLPFDFDGAELGEKRQIGGALDLVEIFPSTNKRTFIQRATGAILVIQKAGEYYFFTLRMSKSVIQDSYGLLVTGCSMVQSIRVDGWLKSHMMKRDVSLAQCTTLCSDIPTERGFQKRCRFDCGVTKDEQFVNMTREATKDIKMVEERDSEMKGNSITKWPTKTAGCLGSSSPEYVIWTALVLLSALPYVRSSIYQ